MAAEFLKKLEISDELVQDGFEKIASFNLCKRHVDARLFIQTRVLASLYPFDDSAVLRFRNGRKLTVEGAGEVDIFYRKTDRIRVEVLQVPCRKCGVSGEP